MLGFKNSLNQRNNALKIFTCLLALFSSIAYAEDSSSSDQSVTIQTVISGIVLIVTGVIFCFFGRKVYRLTLFLIGLYVGTILGWMVLTNFEPENGYGGSASPTIILIVSFAIGFIAGLLFACFGSLAIWLLGALAGYALSIFILSLTSDGLIQSKTGRIIFIVIFILVGLLLTFFFENEVIIFGTSFIGSYAIFIGIDMFANTGFANSVRSFVDGNHKVVYNADVKVYLMIAGMIILFIIGALFQFKNYRSTPFHPDGKTRTLRPSGKTVPTQKSTTSKEVKESKEGGV